MLCNFGEDIGTRSCQVPLLGHGNKYKREPNGARIKPSNKRTSINSPKQVKKNASAYHSIEIRTKKDN